MEPLRNAADLLGVSAGSLAQLLVSRTKLTYDTADVGARVPVEEETEHAEVDQKGWPWARSSDTTLKAIGRDNETELTDKMAQHPNCVLFVASPALGPNAGAPLDERSPPHHGLDAFAAAAVAETLRASALGVYARRQGYLKQEKDDLEGDSFEDENDEWTKERKLWPRLLKDMRRLALRASRERESTSNLARTLSQHLAQHVTVEGEIDVNLRHCRDVSDSSDTLTQVTESTYDMFEIGKTLRCSTVYGTRLTQSRWDAVLTHEWIDYGSEESENLGFCKRLYRRIVGPPEHETYPRLRSTLTYYDNESTKMRAHALVHVDALRQCDPLIHVCQHTEETAAAIRRCAFLLFVCVRAEVDAAATDIRADVSHLEAQLRLWRFDLHDRERQLCYCMRHCDFLRRYGTLDESTATTPDEEVSVQRIVEIIVNNKVPRDQVEIKRDRLLLTHKALMLLEWRRVLRTKSTEEIDFDKVDTDSMLTPLRPLCWHVRETIERRPAPVRAAHAVIRDTVQYKDVYVDETQRVQVEELRRRRRARPEHGREESAEMYDEVGSSWSTLVWDKDGESFYGQHELHHPPEVRAPLDYRRARRERLQHAEDDVEEHKAYDVSDNWDEEDRQRQERPRRMARSMHTTHVEESMRALAFAASRGL
ncbi:MAG: hypothetical protein MHM6MM_004859 [Cercozoa sp. M6MM]